MQDSAITTKAATQIIKFIYPGAFGILPGIALESIAVSMNWQHPLILAIAGSTLATLALGFIDRAITWRAQSLQHTARIAEIISNMQREYNDRSETMRLEQRAYYRELLADVLERRNLPPSSLRDAEAERQAGTSGSLKSPT